MNKHVFLLLTGITIVMAGCNLAPEYERPDAPVPDEWPTGPAYSQNPEASDAPLGAEVAWQDFFTDERLQKLIEAALSNNRDLRIAALNAERVRALYDIQRAELWPTLDGVGSGSKQRVPADLSSTGRRQTIERYDANLGLASWEIDFFGRIRNLKDRALEEYLATEQARRSVQILLISSVADAYLALAADRENLSLSETTLAAQQESYNLVKRLYDLGLTKELDLYRAQAPLEIARRDVARYQQLVAQDINTLNLLVGSETPDELLPNQLSDFSLPLEISAGVSSEVLLYRPDVLQAESMLKAAHADIGAARAAFFPRISLTTSVGTSSSELSGLFESGSGTWAFAPQIVMPIFDARLWAAHRAAKVQQEMAITEYERSIQIAFREVADTLAARGTVDDQIMAQQSLVDAFAETYRLSDFRFKKGIDDYLGVLDAQRSLFAAQQVLIVLRQAKYTNDVRLYSVLGGGGDSPANL